MYYSLQERSLILDSGYLSLMNLLCSFCQSLLTMKLLSCIAEITGSPVASNFLSSFPQSHESNPSVKLLFHEPATEINSNKPVFSSGLQCKKTEAPVTSCCRLFGFDLTSKPASAPIPPDKQLIGVDSNNSDTTKCQDPNSSNSTKEQKQQTSTRSRTKVKTNHHYSSLKTQKRDKLCCFSKKATLCLFVLCKGANARNSGWTRD